MWRPVLQQNRDSDAMNHDGDGCNNPESIECSSSRQIWVWIHVSALSEGFDALKLACQKEVRILNLVLKSIICCITFLEAQTIEAYWLKLPTPNEVSLGKSSIFHQAHS
jgi:hypothetical protein